MKLLGSNENKITKDENGENLPHLEITDVVLVHWNIVNNDYQQDSRVLSTFIPNIPLVNFSPLKTFNSKFQTIEVWFTDQNGQSLETEEHMKTLEKLPLIKDMITWLVVY